MRMMLRVLAGCVVGYVVASVLCRGARKAELAKCGRHDTRRKDEGTHLRAWIRGVGSWGANGSLYLGDRRLVAVLVWREGSHASDTIAWLALLEVVGFYVGAHRINGKSYNWVF